MVKKKIISGLVIATMVFSACPAAFASSSINQDLNTTTINELDKPIVKSSKHKTVKEYVDTKSGTKYSADGNKKVKYNEKHYKVYDIYMPTGNKTLAYHQYEWSWKGYEKNKSGEWEYKTQQSGTSRQHLDPKSYIESFLGL